MNELLLLFVIALIFLAAGFFIGTVIARRRDSESHQYSMKKQRVILGGKFSETIATLLPQFPPDLKASEARFLGDPIDYIFFKGRDDHKIDEVVFLEVKSGHAQLSGIEVQLKDAIDAGRVRWAEYHVPREVTNEVRNPNA